MSFIQRNVPRPIKLTPDINPYSMGSIIAEFGNTKVHITASVEEQVPPFLKGKGQGWITAEYAMLPGSTAPRHARETNKISGRTHEIQRLIGRSMRSVVDLKKLGERSITIDCDVLVADGGTRTTSISGGFVALALALRKLKEQGALAEIPILEAIAAISIGITPEGQIIADLNYQEDSSCATDMNIVMTRSGRFVEVQGTAEKEPFGREHLNEMLDCAWQALQVVFEEQQRILSC
jgi:ribonuclease PH